MVVVLTASKKELICVLALIGNKPLQLRTRLVNSKENNLKFSKLKPIFQSSCKLGSLFRHRDSLEKEMRSDIVYRYSKCKVTYYGKTYRQFSTGAAEQVGISNLTAKRLKSVKKLAKSDHLLECNCSIDFDIKDIFDRFNILASDTNKFRLPIKESLLIKRDQPQLNKTNKSFPLKLFDWKIFW